MHRVSNVIRRLVALGAGYWVSPCRARAARGPWISVRAR